MTAAKELDAMTEKLNTLLILAEEAIRALGLNVTASVPLTPNDTSLVWARREDKTWGLHVTSVRDPDCTAGRTPILHASREKRILTAKSIDRLIAEMTRVADHQLVEVRSAIETLETLLVAFDESARIQAAID